MVTDTSPLSRRSTRRPQGAQHLGHGVHVVDARDVGEHRATLGQQAGHHQLERRILRPACADGAPERSVGLDDDLIHGLKYRRWRAARRAGGDPRPTMVRARGDVAPSPRPEPRHGPRADDRGGRHGRQPLDGPGRQGGRRRRRRRGHADRALQRPDGRDRRHRRGREGQRAHALQRREDRRRHAAAHRHRGGPDRRHHADRAGPRRRAGGHRGGRARRHVRPGPVRLHGEARRRATGQGRLRHPPHPDREPPRPVRGAGAPGARPDGGDPGPAPARHPDRRGALDRGPHPPDHRRRRRRRHRHRLARGRHRHPLRHRRHARGRAGRGGPQVHGRRDPGAALPAQRRGAAGRRSRPATRSTRC